MFAHLSRSIPHGHTTRISALCRHSSSAGNSTLDRTQLEFMKEKCILVDEQDQVVGSASKEECTIWQHFDFELY